MEEFLSQDVPQVWCCAPGVFSCGSGRLTWRPLGLCCQFFESRIWELAKQLGLVYSWNSSV